MFIKSLQLTNFKRFKELNLEFPADITVLKGPNEQGKSTIAQALIAALFYDPAKLNEDIKNCKAWGCDKFYTIKLIFEANGDEYTLEKDFENKKIALKNASTLEVVDSYKEIMKLLSQLGGYQTPELFFNTACVKQGELAVLDKKETLTEALMDIVSGTGGAVSLNSIFKRIEKAHDELMRGMERGIAKNPGAILRLKNEISEKSRLLEEKERIFKEEDIARQNLGKFRAEKSRLAGELEVKEKIYGENIAYFEGAKVLERLNAEYEKISRVAETVERLHRERGELANSFARLKKIGSLDVRPLLDMQNDAEGIVARITELSREVDEMKKRGINLREIIDKKYLIIASIIAIVGFLGFFLHKIFFLSWVFGGLFSFWLAFSKSVFHTVSVKKLSGELQKLSEAKSEKLGQISGRLQDLGAASIEEIEARKKEAQDIAKQIEIVDGKIEGALGGAGIEEIARQKRELAKRIGVEDEKIAQIGRAGIPGREEHAILERDLDALRKKIADLDRKAAGAEAIIAHAKAPYEEITKLEEKLYALEEELRRAEARNKMLTILWESLHDAQQKTFGTTRKILEQYIGEFLSEITEGKYSAISIGQNMKIKVFSPEKGEEIEPEDNLSKGALEQLYLVARFALISLMYSRAARPLAILDDPFGNFDAERKAKTRHVLKKLSENFQILLLTCSNEYDKWGKVVDLAVIQ